MTSKPKIQKIVLTGGPCAGKTTITQVIGRVFHDRVVIVPESATMLFKGGFPRWNEPAVRDATQRAIYNVQCQLEEAYAAHHPGKVLIMDRGTLDGAAYWSTGAKGFFKGVGTTLNKELKRYDQVLFLESAGQDDYIINMQKNPARIETWDEARVLDQETRKLWSEHPHLEIIKNRHSFDFKIAQVLKWLNTKV